MFLCQPFDVAESSIIKHCCPNNLKTGAANADGYRWDRGVWAGEGVFGNTFDPVGDCHVRYLIHLPPKAYDNLRCGFLFSDASGARPGQEAKYSMHKSVSCLGSIEIT